MSLPGDQPVFFKPSLLRRERFTPQGERPQQRTTHGTKVGSPSAVGVGLEVRGPLDVERPQGGQIDGFTVQTADGAARIDDQFHGRLLLLGFAEDVPPGPVDEQPVQHGLHAAEFRSNVLPEVLVVAKVLRLDAPHDPLGVGYEPIQFVV